MALNTKQLEILNGNNQDNGEAVLPSLNTDQQAIMDEFNQGAMTDLGSQDFQGGVATTEKAQVRASIQGASLGIGDEIEAMARSMASSRPYKEIRDEIRAKLSAYQQAHPGEALSYELLGAVAPTALAYLAPVPGAGPATTASTAARTGSWLNKAKPVMKRGALEGTFAGYSTGEEGVIEDISRMPMGAGLGTLFAGGTTALMGVGGSIINSLMNKARNTLGDKAANVVGVELQRLVDATGFTADEVIDKIARGEILAENATLEATVRAYKAEMPKGGAIDTTLPARAKKTKDIASEELQEGLTPGTEGNVYKAYTASDKVAKEQENKLYTSVFNDTPELTSEIVDTLADAIKRNPNAKDALGEIYQAKGGLVPFYKILDNGEVKIVRMPTLEDAEIVRRSLGESTSGAFKTGKGALGEPLSALETKLRQQLDDFSPTLKAVRQNASQIRGARDAYKLGRGSLSKNVDETAVALEDLMGSAPTIKGEAALKAFRAGAMVALRDKIRKMPTYLGRVADEGSHENQLLRTIFPETKIDDLLDKARIAGQSQTAKQRVLGGSPTAPQQKASDLLGTGTLATRAASGDPVAQLQLAGDLVKMMRPEMTPQQKESLVELLLSEDADFVKKALMSETRMAKLQQRINTLGNGLQQATSRASAFQGGKEGGDLSTGLLNLFGK